MHAVYKAVALEDARRVIDCCRDHSVQNGGLFEVYPGPNPSMAMMIVNSCSGESPMNSFRPLGTFYCNFIAPGVISIEEDPHFDGADSRKRHTEAVKQVIDAVLEKGRPGVRISFNDLPALKDQRFGILSQERLF